MNKMKIYKIVLMNPNLPAMPDLFPIFLLTFLKLPDLKILIP